MVQKGILVYSMSRMELLIKLAIRSSTKYILKIFFEKIFLDQINFLSLTLIKSKLQANCLSLG